MSHGKHDGYLDDVPMTISRLFKPKDFTNEINEPLPKLSNVEKSLIELSYNFREERDALEVAQVHGAEKAKKAQEEEDRRRLREEQLEQERVSQKEAEENMSQMKLSPVNESEAAAAAAEDVKSNCNGIDTRSIPSSVADRHGHPNGLNQSKISHMAQDSSMVKSVPSAAPQQQQQLTILKPTASTFVPLVPASSSSIQLQPPNLRPLLSQSVINPRDFESGFASSPFDDALLRAIDDRQELSSIFQNAYSMQSMYSGSNSSSQAAGASSLISSQNNNNVAAPGHAATTASAGRGLASNHNLL